MLDSSMNSILFAKKLRIRQAQLKVKYKKDLDKYARDFESWKVALSHFLVKVAKKNVERILRSQFDDNRYSDDYWKNIVLAECPKPPKRPTNEIIRKIAAALRHIAITGQKTYRVDTVDLEMYFGGENELDSDD